MGAGIGPGRPEVNSRPAPAFPEDVAAVVVEVAGGGALRALGNEERRAHRPLAEEEVGPRLAHHEVPERVGPVDETAAVHREEPAVERRVVGGAGADAVPGIEPLPRGGVPPRLDVTREEQPVAAQRTRREAAEAAAVVVGILFVSEPGERRNVRARAFTESGTVWMFAPP